MVSVVREPQDGAPPRARPLLADGSAETDAREHVDVASSVIELHIAITRLSGFRPSYQAEATEGTPDE